MELDPQKTSGPTMVALVGITVFMLILGVKWAASDYPDLSSGASSSNCISRQVRQGDTVVTADVLVSVFNAGSKSGAAIKALNELEERGFAPGSSGNTTEADVRRVEVWADPLSPAAQLVAAQFGKDTQILGGQPLLGEGVVVVVGNRFKGLKRTVEDVVAENDATICSPTY